MSRKTILLIISGLCLAIVLASLGYFYYQQNQPANQARLKVRPPVTQDEEVLAEVAGQKIYLKDVKQAALRQFDLKAINQTTLERILDQMIERIILDTEAKSLGIVVTEDQAKAEAKKNLTPQYATQSASLAPYLIELTKYELMKKAITANVVGKKEAFTIGFWLPPKGSTKPEFDPPQRRKDGDQALEEIYQRLKNGEDLGIVTKSIFNKFPLLQSVLTFNGTYLSKITGEDFYSEPKVFEIALPTLQEPYWSILLSMKDGEVKKVIGKNEAGGLVLKLISSSKGFPSYSDWLKAKEKELVTFQGTISKQKK